MTATTINWTGLLTWTIIFGLCAIAWGAMRDI